jgi:hypothetical protein
MKNMEQRHQAPFLGFGAKGQDAEVLAKVPNTWECLSRTSCVGHHLYI